MKRLLILIVLLVVGYIIFAVGMDYNWWGADPYRDVGRNAPSNNPQEPTQFVDYFVAAMRVDVAERGRITDEQAERLAKSQISLYFLTGLTSITDNQAESLSKVESLTLNGLTTITDKQAESLGEVESLALNGLTSITDEQAESLSKVGKQRVDIEIEPGDVFLLNQRLSLMGLTSINDEQAKSLSKVEDLTISEALQPLIDKYKKP
jgi:hypothetical protein